jgi:hypothetical protein
VRAGGIAFLAVAAAWLAGAEAASAVVGCQTQGGRLKLRPDACKPGKERLAFDAGADPTGVWRWTSGPPAQGSADTFTEYVVLAQDGSGRLHRRQRSAGTLDCRDLAYARSLSAALTVDAYGAEGAEVWQGRLAGPDALELTDASGALTRFERAASVEAAFECVEPTETRRFTGLPAPNSWTGLAYDGVSLWYEEEYTEKAYPVDPATGTVGTPVDLGASTQYSHLHAVQAGDFWAHCACGGSTEAWRVTAAGVFVDEVRPGTDFGSDLSVDAIARDDAGAVLWLYGYSYDAQTRRLLQVQSDLEPDVLLAPLDVGFYVHSLTWDGSALWGLQWTKLYRIDPLTGLVTDTYALPDVSVEWRGVAAANGELWVIGRSAGGDGVLVSVAP